jgi:hypothetical protein
VPKKVLRPGELFNTLDNYLKTSRTKLGDLFSQYDGDRDGELTLRELAALLRDLRLPEVTKADILYFQVGGAGRGWVGGCAGRRMFMNPLLVAEWLGFGIPRIWFHSTDTLSCESCSQI